MCRFWGKKDETTGDNELERFRKSVKDARRLSDFAISEGAGVDDETIEVINQATEFLDNDNPPSGGRSGGRSCRTCLTG
ncbi:MAG: hypothetical protein U9Q89_02005 [Thermodesulfobacteriota bacterium]|nr:hypothetical protein [Thermodesulfobacteriota bacterium]